MLTSRILTRATATRYGFVKAPLDHAQPSFNMITRGAHTRSRARFSSPRFTTSPLFFATGAIAFTASLYAYSSPGLHLEEAQKRKSYVERAAEANNRDLERIKAERALAAAAQEETTKPFNDTDSTSKSQVSDDLEESSQESAFDPETNTINWDCPCLGGMAHGPCGEDFKKAFSCFVFSDQEPKGIDCVENFKAMQDCFRRYPEHYKEELEDYEDGEDTDTHVEAVGKNDGSENRDMSQASASGAEASHIATEDEVDEGLRELQSEIRKEWN